MSDHTRLLTLINYDGMCLALKILQTKVWQPCYSRVNCYSNSGEVQFCCF